MGQPWWFFGHGNGRTAPLLIGLRHQGQIKQPFAGVVNNIDVQFSAVEPPRQKTLRFIFKGQAQLADASGAFWPMAIFTCQGSEMFFIGETRQIIIGLGFKIAAGDAALGMGLEHRHAGTLQKRVNQCRDKHGLSRTRKSGDTEAQSGVKQARGKVLQAASRNPAAIDKIRKPHVNNTPSWAHSWRFAGWLTRPRPCRCQQDQRVWFGRLR